MGVLNSEDQAKVVHAINETENKTSGEIRVAVEKHCKTNPLDRATYFFTKLKMHETAARNGVLIYLAIDDHEFALVGDEGIHQYVGADFWEETKGKMIVDFKKGHLVGGLVVGIKHIGDQLEKFFPNQSDDINELPNDIVFGEN